MEIFRRCAGLSAIAIGLGGCAVHNAPPSPAPDAHAPPAPAVSSDISSRAVVPVSAVVNQLKCDVGAFLKSQAAHPGAFTVYNVTGTLTFSLERSTTNGWSVAVAPSFPILPFGPGLGANIGRSKSTTDDVGDDVILKFDMQAQPDPVDDPHARTAIDQGACHHGLASLGGPGGSTHIIEPEALRQQVDGIVLGAPKIGFSTVEYKGKFLLKQSDDQKNAVSLYIVSASLPGAQQDSSYTQQFDITLDLEPPKAAPGAGPAPEPTAAAASSLPRHPHLAPHRTMAAPPAEADHPPASEEETPPPMLGASPPATDAAARGVSDHLKRLIEAIPEPSPH